MNLRIASAISIALLLPACGVTRDTDETVATLSEPVIAVPGTDPAQFAAGQALFEQVYPPAPTRNGQSCVECHSVPVTGGMGFSTHFVVPSLPRFVDGVEQDRSGLPFVVPPSLLALGGIDAEPIACGVDEAIGIHGIAVLAGRPTKDKPARWGHKLGTTTEHAFTQGAFVHELGLCTEPADPDEGTGCAPGQAPDVTAAEIADVAYFLAHAAAPPPLPPPAGGEALFVSTGCVVCHSGPLRTDLCAHDLGPAMADGDETDQLASSKWRTTPLVYMRGRYGMGHDGRAGWSVDAAITMLHGGEGDVSRSRYLALPSADRVTLAQYVRGL